MRALLLATAAIVTSLLPSRVGGQPLADPDPAPYCAVSGLPPFDPPEFAELRARLRTRMGVPLECVHDDPETGDALQHTSTGLAYRRRATGLPTFTNGAERWVLVDRRVRYWKGDSIDPPLPGDPPTSEVTIVSRVPRTTFYRFRSYGISNAIAMALEDIDYRVGSVAIGHEELDLEDDGEGDPARATEQAARVAADSGVVAYVGPISSAEAAAIMPILDRAGLLGISPSNTTPELTRVVGSAGRLLNARSARAAEGRTYVRLAPPGDLQGAAGAAWASQLGVRRVVVLKFAGDTYGDTVAATFLETATRLGIDVPGGVRIVDPGGGAYRELAVALRGVAPDLVYVSGRFMPGMPRLVEDIRAALGAEIKLMGSSALRSRDFGGPASEGMYVTVEALAAPNLTGRGAAWYDDYVARFHDQPDLHAAYGYEATRVILDAIAQTGRADREAIRAAVVATTDYDGVLGRWSFDENGDLTPVRVSGMRVQYGSLYDRDAVPIEIP